MARNAKSRLTDPALTGPLLRAQNRFQRWRSTRRKRTPVPEALWETAVGLARVHGTNCVARALRLNYYALKRRVGAARALCESEDTNPSNGPFFVEMGVCPPAEISECSVEMEDAHGAQIRIQMKGKAAAIDLAALSRCFLRGEA